ncbi:hypothetical protein SXCC_01151 [Gluconacetobacter sp. SXCC-1]|nr:hypothetical protein SXCC_01151 [Gluconacetobacter sp. SXCC-1]
MPGVPGLSCPCRADPDTAPGTSRLAGNAAVTIEKTEFHVPTHRARRIGVIPCAETFPVRHI